MSRLAPSVSSQASAARFVASAAGVIGDIYSGEEEDEDSEVHRC